MKAALAQLISAKGDPAANLEKMSSAIKEASAKGAELYAGSPATDPGNG